MPGSKTSGMDLHKIYVPSLEDIIHKGECAAFGIMFSQDDTLYYFKFEAPEEYLNLSYKEKHPEKRIFKIAKNKGSEIWSIFNNGTEVWYDEHHVHIRELFSEKKFDRENWVTSIESHDGTLLDSGLHSICETESSKILIDEESLNKSAVTMVDKLRSSGGILYAAVTYEGDNHAIRHIQQSSGGAFELGSSILDYSKHHNYPYSFDIMPVEKSMKSGKKISVISSVNQDSLNIDSREVAGSKESGALTDLKILRASSAFVQVFYTGEFGNIAYAEINISSASVESKKMLFPEGLIGGKTTDALSLVLSPELDKRLVDISKNPRYGE